LSSLGSLNLILIGLFEKNVFFGKN
jgi:aquaporin Z